MAENTTIDEHGNEFKKWFLKFKKYGIVGVFFLGVLSAIFFGNLISISKLPEFSQEFLGSLNLIQSPYDISGDYYYVTTPQNIPNIPVKCNGSSNAEIIAGFVKINDKRTIINSEITFVEGRREYCISNEKEIKSFANPITWVSEWAHINNGKLYAKIKIGDDKVGILEANHPNKKNFSAYTLYMWEEKGSQQKKYRGIVDIKFTKCEECDEDLRGELRKLGEFSSSN